MELEGWLKAIHAKQDECEANNLRKVRGQRQQWGGHCHNGGRNDGGLELGDGSSVREKEMDLRAIEEADFVGFHNLLDVKNEEEQGIKHSSRFLAWTTWSMVCVIHWAKGRQEGQFEEGENSVLKMLTLRYEGGLINVAFA